MKRKEFIQQINFTASGIILSPLSFSFDLPEDEKKWQRMVCNNLNSPRALFPPEKRIPLGWKAFPVPANGNESTLHFPKIGAGTENIWLRLTAAIDFREEITVAAFLPESKKEIGVFDIRFAHPFQPFEIPVNTDFLAEINQQGIALRMVKGTKDAWFFQPNIDQVNNQGLQPHLLIDGITQPDKDFRENLLSMNSFSPFGWMGGCVVDALWEMSQKGDEEALKTLKKQLGYFLDNEKGIVFESPMTEPKDGSFNSIEDFLPFAAIVSLYPKHPSVQMAVDYCLSRLKPDGLIASGNHITTEGCYTLAYPLAQIAIVKNNRELAGIALDQLVHRIHYLSAPDAVFQRNNLGTGTGFKNWGRGITWYVLGMVKTIHLFEKSAFADLPQVTIVQSEFVRVMNWLVQFQDTQGMWCSFIDRPETLADTSATSGIATAMVWGVHLNLLPETYLQKAELAEKGLLKYLTPDGFLTHVSQINRGGEKLQSGGYRVISQFGMGLLAQLQAQMNA
jgi:unsaturated rhamnogalacturonyl hydrolase